MLEVGGSSGSVISLALATERDKGSVGKSHGCRRQLRSHLPGGGRGGKGGGHAAEATFYASNYLPSPLRKASTPSSHSASQAPPYCHAHNAVQGFQPCLCFEAARLELEAVRSLKTYAACWGKRDVAEMDLIFQLSPLPWKPVDFSNFSISRRRGGLLRDQCRVAPEKKPSADRCFARH